MTLDGKLKVIGLCGPQFEIGVAFFVNDDFIRLGFWFLIKDDVVIRCWLTIFRRLISVYICPGRAAKARVQGN